MRQVLRILGHALIALMLFILLLFVMMMSFHFAPRLSWLLVAAIVALSVWLLLRPPYRRALLARLCALAMLIAVPFAFVAGLTDIHDAPPTLQRR